MKPPFSKFNLDLVMARLEELGEVSPGWTATDDEITVVDGDTLPTKERLIEVYEILVDERPGYRPLDAADRNELQQLKQLYQALKDGNATNRQAQRALAFLIKRAAESERVD